MDEPQRDAEALAAVTRAGLPDLPSTARALRQRTETRGGWIMKTLRTRWFLGTLSTAALTAAVLLLPMSYEVTVGHEVRITVPAAEVPPPAMAPLAREVKRALGARSLQVRAADGEAVLSAQLPERSRRAVEARAAAIVAELAARRVHGRSQVTPRRELVSGRVYAMAAQRIIEVRVDMSGKSDGEIAEEIRAQLQRAGLSDPAVTVQRSGDETDVRVEATDEGREQVIHQRRRGGGDELHLEMGGIDDAREPGMTDAQLQAKIERQLQARGLRGTVTVQGDRIEIRAQRSAP